MSAARRTTSDPMISSETGKPMVRDVRPMTITLEGESITFDMPGWYSDEPDDGLHDQEDMKASDAALHALRARLAARLSGAEVRRIRKKLGLTQKAATELFVGSGAVNTFQKYESGATAVSYAVSNLLWLLDRRPELLADLKQRFAEKSLAAAE